MVESASRVLLALTYAFLGSLSIACAIREYKKGSYFAGVFSSMVVIWLVFQLARTVFMEGI